VSTLQHRDKDVASAMSPFARLDRMFDEWMRTVPMRRPFGGSWDTPADAMINIDEFRDGDTQVIRAELPGIDPDRDVQLTAQDGVLRIQAERRVEKDTEDKGYIRHELQYGSFSRTLPLPDGAAETDIQATYKDGILEVRVPVPQPPAERQPTTIPVTKA
jgi:HSP20 family protein